MSNAPAQPAKPLLACRAKQNWKCNSFEVDQNPGPKLELTKGDLGWAHNQRGPWLNVDIKQNGKFERGWVHVSAIEIGQRHADPIPIKFPPPVPLPGPPPINPNNDVLMKTLKAIWYTIKNSGNAIVDTSDQQKPSIQRVLFGAGVDRYAELIYRNIVPEALAVMRNGNFDPRDLVDRVPEIGPLHSPDAVRGTYIYYFNDVKDGLAHMANADNPPRDALYSGQSMNFPNRQTMHEACIDNKPHQGKQDSLKYRVARTSPPGGRKMIPLILFRTDDPEVAHFTPGVMMNVAELTQVCLFQSWLPLLIKGSPPATSGTRVADYEYARKLSNMMRLINSKTGWNPRPTLGLNWMTPAVSFSEQDREWLSWYNLDRGCHIYRASRKVSMRTQGGHIEPSIHWRSSRQSYLNISERLARDANFANGDSITIVVEIRNDGSRYCDHPLPLIRVPRPCHNKEFEKLRSMSVQIQWVDKRTQAWKAAYVQMITIRKGPPQGELTHLVHGMDLFSTLTQTTYRETAEKPGWLNPLDNTVIRQLRVSHISQEAEVLVDPLRGEVRDWPKNNTVAENTTRLRQCMPTSFRSDVYFGKKPTGGSWNHRAKCDLCLSSSDVRKVSSPLLMIYTHNF